MKTMNPASSDFGVQMGDHIYPAVEQPYEAFVPNAPEIIHDDSPNQVKKQMAESIEELLPFLSQVKHGNDKTSLFGDYVDSVTILERCRGEVQQLFGAMIETVLEVDSAGALSADVRSEILTDIMKDAEIQLSRPENLATAEIAAMEPNRIQACLQASLRKSIGNLVTELIDGLGVLVDRSVAGLQHWPSPNSVKYHFFRRRIAQTGVRVSRKRGRVQRRSDEEARGDFRKWKRVHQRKTTSQVTCWLIHHKHETVDAIHTGLENSKVIMPAFVQNLVKQIPDWMRPSICVIDGYLIQETIFEREVSQREFTQVEPEEELLHGHEPAVCLGPFVLTGWGPRDIDLEVERREKEFADAVQEQRGRFWAISAVVCQVFCVLFAHLGVLALSAVLFVGGIASIALWIGHASKRADTQLSELARQRICFGFLALLGGFQLVLTPLSLVFILLGIALVAIGASVLRIDKDTLITLLQAKGA